MTARRVVVVGASMAGLRAAEALRKAGYHGELVVYGAEPVMPYNRPPLSKDALKDPVAVESLIFRLPRAATDISWRLGAEVLHADLDAHTLELDGETSEWDGLVAATGLHPRRLALPGPGSGVHVIRTHQDALALRACLQPGARLVLIGAGFIGCEVAATARALGVEVDVVAPEAVPIERPLGALVGAELQRRHEERGVRFHLGTLPDAYHGGARVEAVELTDGTVLPADVVVEAVGCTPNVGWLQGNGLDLSDGLLCDGELRVQGRPDVVAAGDVARFPNALFDAVPRRVEHWTMATDTARRAGATLAAQLAGRAPDPAPFAPVPSFWSDQYEHRLQSFGAIGLGADVRVLEGELAGESVIGYHRGEELMGVLLIGCAGRSAHYRSLIAARTAIPA
jgi:3-phenylpropionate/trans-cinnamate dioxygenase ferredoxin reductase subunit